MVKVKRDGTVEVNGDAVGRVEKIRLKTTNRASFGGLNYASGFSYRSRWVAYTLDGRRLAYSYQTRKLAVERLVEEVRR